MTLSEVEPAGRRRQEWWVAGGPSRRCIVLLNGGLLALKGVQSGGDTSRYLDGAAGLARREAARGLHLGVRGYMAVVAFWQRDGSRAPGVVGFQIVVAAVAGAAVAALGVRLGGLLAGLVGAAFILINPEVARWHAYILTDSLYISAVVIVTFRGVAGPPSVAAAGTAWRCSCCCRRDLRPTALVLLPVAAAFWGVRGA